VVEIVVVHQCMIDELPSHNQGQIDVANRGWAERCNCRRPPIEELAKGTAPTTERLRSVALRHVSATIGDSAFSAEDDRLRPTADPNGRLLTATDLPQRPSSEPSMFGRSQTEGQHSADSVTIA
jgi:hypothetical protein